MITLFYTESTYVVLYHDADTQAYRTDRFTGWTQQPKDTGPVVFTNTSPTYFNLTPIAGAGGGDDSSSTGLAHRHHRRWRVPCSVVVGVRRDGSLAQAAATTRSSPPPCVRRFVIRKVLGALSTLAFVVVFNFFLFRVVNDDPVEVDVPRAQPHARARSTGWSDSSTWTARSGSSSSRTSASCCTATSGCR